jgi:GGDEF domain-containing protein
VSVDPPHWGFPEVADVRLESLLEETDELAKRWLIALLRPRPLSRAASISLSRFAREAPPLCAALLGALQSDAALDRLRAQPIAAGELAGAREVGDVVDAVEALRAVLWRALNDALPDLDASAAGRVADRLAHVCSLLIASSLTASDREGSAQEPPAASENNNRAPRIELQELRADGGDPVELEDPWAIDAPDDVEDATRAEDVTAEIERRSGEGERFVVLLIEVVGFERLREAEGPAELDDLLAAVQRALSDALGPAERLAAEGAGRWWLVARGAREPEGRSLAELLARSVSAAVAHRRVPLKVAIGVAASPENGHDAAGLAERAEEELFAARAAGVCVLPAGAARAAAPAPASEP